MSTLLKLSRVSVPTDITPTLTHIPTLGLVWPLRCPKLVAIVLYELSHLAAHMITL